MKTAISCLIDLIFSKLCGGGGEDAEPFDARHSVFDVVEDEKQSARSQFLAPFKE